MEEDKLIYKEGKKEWWQRTLSSGRVIVFIIDNSPYEE